METASNEVVCVVFIEIIFQVVEKKFADLFNELLAVKLVRRFDVKFQIIINYRRHFAVFIFLRRGIIFFLRLLGICFDCESSKCRRLQTRFKHKGSTSVVDE